MSRPKAVAFEHHSARRIATQVRQRERMPIGGKLDPERGGKFLGDLRIAIVKTTSAITARSGATPGTGTAVMVTWSGTAIVDGSDSMTVRNISAKTGGIATGKYGFAIYLFLAWWIFSIEC